MSSSSDEKNVCNAQPTRILTGIKPSGTPHIGNYVGAIRPALNAGHASNTESFYFLADLHSLVNTTDPVRVQQSTLSIAATWLAAGLDPDKAWFYRQSDIPEIGELNWLLTCVASKGILNRAHAYKAAVDANRAAGEDGDAGVNAGLFMYPVLMSADILIFNADKVPVGRDQVQHIEMARDFAQRFHHIYGSGHFALPEAVIDENVATLPGLDGRKMSKSYDNVIPLFATRNELRKLIFGVKTNSQLPGEPKQTDGSSLFQMFQAFARPEEAADFAHAFAGGIAWGDAKQRVFEQVDAELSPLRERYMELTARPGDIEAVLRDHAQRLREQYARPLLARLRDAVGLRDLSRIVVRAAPEKKKALPSFKQYRGGDGLFYFKLASAQGAILLESSGYEHPREAGKTLEKAKASSSEEELLAHRLTLHADAAVVLEALSMLSNDA